MEDTDLEMVKFNAYDRCDRCGSQALAIARHDEMPAELLFCWHHKDRHGDALLDQGWEIIEDVETYESYRPRHSVPA